MNAALCLVGYGVVVSVVAPHWLSRAAGGGPSPLLGVTALLLALGTTT